MKRATVSLEATPALLEGWMGHLGLAVKALPSLSGDEQAFPNRIELRGDDAALLGAQKGQPLDALQHLLQERVGGHDESTQPFLDADSLRLARMKELKVMARFGAERAREMGFYAFAPLSPRERRWIHMEISAMEGLTTESEGTGHFKALRVIRK
ncbi:MAG TPA: R3H domain-containing nucleic acid-binding protein [Holophagaceae bacterium]|nr:R3H domain-containing nucleic acid-binding protein [Holophagaceae bacterium]